MQTSALIGRNVHLVLWERGIPQRLAADAVGLSQSTMSKKLRGGVPWTVDELSAVAAFLDVPVTDLLPRVDSNHQPAGYWYPQVARALAVAA